jgi:hypothetical protein
MRTFPSEEALVAAYWRKLARSIDRPRGGKRQKPSRFKLGARPGVRQRFTASRNVEPALATRRARGSRTWSDRTLKYYQDRKVPR